MKQAIIIRKDLKLGKGKMAAQAAHASLEAYRKASFIKKRAWQVTGQKKVILKIENEKEMILLYNKAKANRINARLIRDAGKTEIPQGTITALALGPDSEEKIDKIAGHLKLY